MALGERLTGSLGLGPETASSGKSVSGFRPGAVFITHRMVIRLPGRRVPTVLAEYTGR
jgi:hypothetical protein